MNTPMNLMCKIGPRLQLVLAGVALTLGFAPFDLWPLAFAGLVVWALQVRAALTRKQAAIRSLWFAMAHGISAIYWLPWAFWHDSDSMAFAVFGGVPAMLGIAYWLALGYVLAAVVAWRWRGNTAQYFAVLGAALVLIDVLRMTTPYGFPWLPLGALWVGSSPGAPLLAQLAHVGGMPLLSAMVAAVVMLIATLRPTLWLCAALIIATTASYGAWRTLDPIPQEGPMVRVVQPNLGAHKWDPVRRWDFLRETLWVATMPNLNGTPATPDVVVLPETGVPFLLAETPEALAMIHAALGPSVTLITGSIRREENENGERFYNTVQSLQNSTILASADKRLLVPFGEFIPLRGVLDNLPLPVTLRVLSQSRTDFSHGTGPMNLVTPFGLMTGLICYEGIFPFFVAQQAQNAVALMNVTNDAWFTGTTALYQHAALQRVRSIETGLPLLRSANTGISMVVDGHGRILKALPPSAAGVMDVRLPNALPKTLWQRSVL
jgi:apolipoprotein N-acyltransferase